VASTHVASIYSKPIHFPSESRAICMDESIPFSASSGFPRSFLSVLPVLSELCALLSVLLLITANYITCFSCCTSTNCSGLLFLLGLPISLSFMLSISGFCNFVLCLHAGATFLYILEHFPVCRIYQDHVQRSHSLPRTVSHICLPSSSSKPNIHATT